MKKKFNFEALLKPNEILKKNEIGNFTGGYDVSVSTGYEENPYSNTHCDVKYYDYCYDGNTQYEDYRGGNYALPE